MHTKKEIDLLLHKLWTKAVGTESYNKQEWLLLERMIWEDSPINTVRSRGLKMLKEIKPPTMEDLGYKPSDKTCPNCQTPMYHGPVPCPEGRMGCLVVHYGYTCSKCGKKWN